MLDKIREMRKNKKKGFTLVEIIVVLIILAVLAAALIPTMIRFVDEANGKAYVAQARAVYVAAQTVATEEEAKNPAGTLTFATTSDEYKKAAYLSEMTDTLGGAAVNGTAVITVLPDGKVTEVVYTSQDGAWKVDLKPGESAEATKV